MVQIRIKFNTYYGNFFEISDLWFLKDIYSFKWRRIGSLEKISNDQIDNHNHSKPRNIKPEDR